MDHFKHQKVQNLSKMRKSQYLKRAIQIIMSVSVISFIFSHSSIPQYINAYFSTVSTYSSERKYMFLLCNGILVFLVKNSGLIDNSAQETIGLLDVVEQVKNNYGSPCSAPELPTTNKTFVAELVEEIDEEHEQNDGLFFITEDFDNNEEEEEEEEEIDEEHEQNDGLFFITEDFDNNEEEEEEEEEEIDEEHEQNDGLFFITEDVDNNEEEEGPNELLVATSEQEDSLGSLSREELNKKCDEFIRKMKQSIK